MAHYTIGFSNLSERHTFAVIVREGLEITAAEYPDVTVVARDNDYDSERALANAREFADIGVDLAIIFHIDERVGSTMRATLQQHRAIPIIAVDIPIPVTYFFGIHNQQAGLLVGDALGQWIQDNWNAQVDRVLIVTEKRVLGVVQQRLEYGLKGLANRVQYEKDAVFYVDGGNQREISARNSHEVLARWSDFHHIAVIGLNDDSAMGVLDAARALGRESDVAVVGQNADLAVTEFRNPHTRLIASANYFPEQYGPRLMELAWKLLQGERLAREHFIEPALVTAESLLRAE
jgi:ribose transport system substrate-binding protein